MANEQVPPVEPEQPVAPVEPVQLPPAVDTEPEITEDEPVPPLWFRLYLSITEQADAMANPFGNISYTIEQIEQALDLRRAAHPQEFGAAISAVNTRLAASGMYFSEHGSNNVRFTILPALVTERRALDNATRKAKRLLVRSMILAGGLAANPKAELAEEDRKRLLKKQERNAYYLAMMARPKSIVKQLNEKHQAELAAEVRQLQDRKEMRPED